MSENSVRCAIAGLGRIGFSLGQDPLREKPSSHSGAIAENRECCLCGGADPEKERRRVFSESFPEAEIFSDASLMLQELKPDIFHIASDTDSHMSLLNTALEAKVPVIICEKPLANSLAEAEALLPVVRKSDSRILINHERRFSRDYRRVRQFVQEGRYGRLLSIHARLYMGRSRSPGVMLYHDGTHMLDILRYLSLEEGEEMEILSCQGNPEKKGASFLICARRGEILLSLELSGGRDHLVFELDLSFETGRIRIGNGVFELWKSVESPYYSGFRSLEKEQSCWEGKTAYFAGMLAHGVELFRNPSRRSESSFEDALAVMRLMDRILSLPS